MYQTFLSNNYNPGTFDNYSIYFRYQNGCTQHLTNQHSCNSIYFDSVVYNYNKMYTNKSDCIDVLIQITIYMFMQFFQLYLRFKKNDFSWLIFQ